MTQKTNDEAFLKLPDYVDEWFDNYICSRPADVGEAWRLPSRVVNTTYNNKTYTSES